MDRPAAIDRPRFRRIPSSPDQVTWEWGSARTRRPARRSALWAAAAGAFALVLSPLGNHPEAPPPAEPVWIEAPSPIAAAGRVAPSSAASTSSDAAPAPRPDPSAPTTSLAPAPPEATRTTIAEPSAPEVGTASVATSEAPSGGGLPASVAPAGGIPVGADGAADAPERTGSVPAAVRAAVPRYPPREEALGIEATVVALVTTDTTGRVVDVRIERSGGRAFDESVRQAALSTLYRVPVRDGRRRAVAFRMPYEFRLD